MGNEEEKSQNQIQIQTDGTIKDMATSSAAWIGKREKQEQVRINL